MNSGRCGWLIVCAAVLVTAQVGLADRVQWSENGNWYEVVVVPGGISWVEAQASAVAMGGHLATLTSEEENLFVFGLTAGTEGAWINDFEWVDGPWLGGYQIAPKPEEDPAAGWRWVTGEPWGYTSWLPGQPDDDQWNEYGEDYLLFWGYRDAGPTATWNDARGPIPPELPQYPVQLAPGFVVEYEFVQATIDINPDTLNLKSAGKWITCCIELPDGVDVGDIDVSTVKLNDQLFAAPQPTQVGDYDGDSVSDLMVKFDRSALALDAGDAVPMTVTGQLAGGGFFAGADTIRVISPGSKGK